MGTVTINIDDDRGFWKGSGDTYARGLAFYEGELNNTGDLIALAEATLATDFDRLVADLTGFFSIVKRTGDGVSMAVDHVQSYPLFYGTADGDAFVSNDAQWIKGQLPDPRVDPLLEFEFLLSGVVTGRDTLYPAIKQLEAGESVALDASGREVSVSRVRYDRFEHRQPEATTEEALLAGLDDVLDRSFRRLLAVADGRQLAVSLSGGPDSRLLVCMLRRLGYDDLVAFTFGHEGSWDTTVATEVADALDVPLSVIRYDHDTWFDWFHSDERVDYYRYAFDFDALPPIGSVPAVGELARSGCIDDDAIVLCGNIVAASDAYPLSFRRTEPFDTERLAGFLVDEYYDFWDWANEDAAAAIQSRIESQLELAREGEARAAQAAYRDWRLRNRNAKLFVSPEEYAFWGYDAWTPLWDPEYVRFWERVPIRYRSGKRLHIEYVDRLYREVADGAAPPDDSAPTGPLIRLESAIAGSPLDGFVRPIYERVERTYKRWARDSPYHRDPLATMGILSEEQFEDLFVSYEQDVHAFKALEIVGCVLFDPPANPAGPIDGRLHLNRLRTEEHATRRESLPWFDVHVPSRP